MEQWRLTGQGGIACRAACRLKLGDAGGALSDCNEVLEHAGGNAKALFRRGQAHLMLRVRL